MNDYGVFANLVAVVTSLAAPAAAITLAFMARAKWQPPDEAVPAATSRVSALMTMIGIGLLFVFGARLGDVVLAAITVLLFLVAVAALIVSISTNTRFSFYYPEEGIEANRLLGGDELTEEAGGVQAKHGQKPQQMLIEVQGNRDLVWTKQSQSRIQIRSTLAFVALIGAGSCSLAAVGMLVVVYMSRGAG